TLPSTCPPSPIRRSEARNSPSIRPKTCAGPLHSMLPTIDMPEPMQEPIPAFVVGSAFTASCSTADRCLIHLLIRTAPAVIDIAISANPPMTRARCTASGILSSESKYDRGVEGLLSKGHVGGYTSSILRISLHRTCVEAVRTVRGC